MIPHWKLSALLLSTLWGASAALPADSPFATFENGSVPASWSTSDGGRLAIVTTPRLQGDRSLRWEWGNGEFLRYEGPLGDPTGYVSSFSFWVHLEEALPMSSLRVEFLESGTVATAFSFGLDFTGWRTGFIPYRDMEGHIPSRFTAMRISLEGPDLPAEGRLHFDQFVFAREMDSRHQYADAQAPFVRGGMDKNHWEPLLSERRREPGPAYTATPEEIAAAAELAGAWQDRLVGGGSVSESEVDRAEDRLAAFGVREEDGKVQGYHIFYNSYPKMAYPPELRASVESDGRNHDFRAFGGLLLSIARDYHQADEPDLRERLRTAFLLGARHLLNQGWADGSNQGCLHHFGYQAREYFKAHFLMREVLAEAGILEECRSAVQWYTRAGQLLEPEMPPNLDYYNTISEGQLLGLLMEENPSLRARWVKAFRDALSGSLATVEPGDGLGLKPDGTAFHHNGHYPAYAVGAFSTLGDIIDELRGTPFVFTKDAHSALRRAVLAMRIYSQEKDWPIGLSGRHPFSGSIAGQRDTFAALAAYPHPETGASPDPEVAAAYMRLWGYPGGALGAEVARAGIQAESLSGMWSFPFAAHAVARQPGWMVSMKGYSRYVWSSEIYTRDNRYGRYQSNGAVEILHEEGREASGFRQDGWDWNRLPGTTGIHLPLDELESPRRGTLMLRSEETFAGAAVMEQETGVFGMILDVQYFRNDLRARKSVFVLEDCLVALGSGIHSVNTVHAVQTTLFQVALDGNSTERQHFEHLPDPVTGLDKSGTATVTTGRWLRDPVGNGYWLGPGSRLEWHRKEQNSRHNKTKEPTSGNFAAAWLDHGRAPDAAAYHYAILPDCSLGDLRSFASDMAGGYSAPYQVLARSDNLHAVMESDTRRLYVAAFAANDNLPLPLIEAVEVPLLLVLEENGDRMKIAATHPDLNPGTDTHLTSPSKIILTGKWQPPVASGLPYWHEGRKTHLVLPAKAGAPFEVELRKTEQAALMPEVRNEKITTQEPSLQETTRPMLHWAGSDAEESIGWFVERRTTAAADYQPVAFLADDADLAWEDASLGEGELAAYRLVQWREGGFSPSSAPVPVYRGSLADGSTVPWAALHGGNEQPLPMTCELLPERDILRLSWENGPSPGEFGLSLQAERTRDFRQWQKVPVSVEGGHRPAAYEVPSTGEATLFYRFTLTTD